MLSSSILHPLGFDFLHKDLAAHPLICVLSQRLMLQPATLATKVLSLTEVVSADELNDDEDYQDILEDMRTECGKFGGYLDKMIFSPCCAKHMA